jgi:hypothetical protein
MILGVCKNIGCTPDYAMHQMSYANVILFSRATPTYDDVKESNDKKKFDESLDANNPANINIIGGEEIVRI